MPTTTYKFPTKIEVKNIDYRWHAFFPDTILAPAHVLTSAGISEIVSMVEDAWWPLEPGHELQWQAFPDRNKFVVRVIEAKHRKLSKTDRG